MTHIGSVGGIQDRTAEVRDLGAKFGRPGAVGGSKVKHNLHVNTVCMSEQVVHTWQKF